jgi:hypothetical protein
MQRWLWVVLISSLVSVSANSVRAQDKSLSRSTGPQLGGRLSRFREERAPEIPSASYLIFQRAQRNAEQRSARIAANKLAGYVPTRPSIGYAAYAADVNPGVYKPWVAAYNGYHFGW